MDSQSKPAAGRSANEVVREAAACKKREDRYLSALLSARGACIGS